MKAGLVFEYTHLIRSDERKQVTRLNGLQRLFCRNGNDQILGHQAQSTSHEYGDENTQPHLRDAARDGLRKSTKKQDHRQRMQQAEGQAIRVPGG